MNEPLTFKPRRSAGWAWLAGFGLVCIGFGVSNALPLPLSTLARGTDG